MEKVKAKGLFKAFFTNIIYAIKPGFLTLIKLDFISNFNLISELRIKRFTIAIHAQINLNINGLFN